MVFALQHGGTTKSSNDQPERFGFARGEFITRVVLAMGLAGLLALTG